MYRVMIRDNMAPLAKDILEATGQIEVVVDNEKETGVPEKLIEYIGEFDGVAIRSGTQFPAEVFKHTGRLKIIGRAGVGVDNVDLNAATEKGIVVMNAPGGNTVTTAEHAISMMLSLARNIPQATATMREGKWEKKKLVGIEITGKTLGIIGLGHIGRVVAERAQGLRMQVLATDPFVSEAAAKELGVELLPLDELLEQAEFISLHVPRLKETLNLIDEQALKKMKPGVRIINCSRGEVVDLNALQKALESGQVAGAALDVLPQEPPDPSLPILQHPNVILTPHLGAATGEAQNKVADMIAKQMAAYLINGVIINAVNFPSISKELLDQIRPHLSLAEKMGALMGQLIRQPHDITVTYSGDLIRFDTRPLTRALLKGLLGVFTDKPVNYVSAPAMARDKGIHVRETTSQAKGDFSNLIQMKLEGHEAEINQIWGTIFGRKYQRIVRLGRIYMDAIPEGSMIVIQNIDKPGVIGNVGTTLGRHNINIGRFQLGRLEDRALCMVNIDTPADDQVLQDLLALPNIISAQQVHFD